MKVIIRTDSSTRMGTGHLMRCLTLAGSLLQEGFEITFICRELPENLSSKVKEKGFQLITLPYNDEEQQKLDSLSEHQQWLGAPIEQEIMTMRSALQSMDRVDLLIVDHYALDEKWESAMRPFTKKIMVIDDLADRKHDCDVLLDQNLYIDLGGRYDTLVPKGCKKLLGPKHALLNPALDEVRRYRSEHKLDGGLKIKRIVVFMGGADVGNFTLRIVQQLLNINLDVVIDVVVGSSNTNKNKINQLCKSHDNFIYHEQPANYYHLLARADLAIGAGGVSVLERLFIKLPSIIFIAANNQTEIARSAEALKLVELAKSINDLNIDIISSVKDKCSALSTSDNLVGRFSVSNDFSVFEEA